MKLKFLGTGTSQGIPVIGSDHPVCLSQNPKDKRLRSSAIITTNSGTKILIDCGPDFRQQMLTNRESDIDAVLLTHEHNDHVIGLDDLRPLIFKHAQAMPLYAQERVIKEIKNRFSYAFADKKYPGAPSFQEYIIENKSFNIGEDLITPIEVMHSKLPIFGYKIGNLSYITDASFIAAPELNKLKGLDVLVLNCLRREEPHHSHFILPQALEMIALLKPKKAYLTHISHLLGFHDEVEKELPQGVHLAYDGLEVEI